MYLFFFGSLAQGATRVTVNALFIVLLCVSLVSMGNSGCGFEAILSRRIIDPKLFRQLCYTGIPMKHRLISYMVLLDVVGLDTSKFKSILGAKALKYQRYLLRALESHNPGSSSSEGASRVSIQAATPHVGPDLEHQIQIDVVRINATYRWFHGSDYSQVFYNVLKITACKRPYIGYAQGMADIVVPILYLHFIQGEEYAGIDMLTIQSAVYSCFSSLVSRIQTDIFQLQEHLLERLGKVLLAADPVLLEHLHNMGLELHMVCFRWFSCLFIREFSIMSWYRIFDSMLCSEIGDFSVFFAAALLIWHREYILTSEFAEIITRMQSLQDSDMSPENIESLIGTANFLRREYENAGK